VHTILYSMILSLRKPARPLKRVKDKDDIKCVLLPFSLGYRLLHIETSLPFSEIEVCKKCMHEPYPPPPPLPILIYQSKEEKPMADMDFPSHYVYFIMYITMLKLASPPLQL
jgi:hypothetical protein